MAATRHVLRLLQSSSVTRGRVLRRSSLVASNPRCPLPCRTLSIMSPSRRSASPLSSTTPKKSRGSHMESTAADPPELHPAQHQVGSSTEGKHDWKKRPPYRVHEPNEHFPVKLEGGCHCGTVRFQLSRAEPLDSKLCHCTTCQKQHAAPFQWAAIFHKYVSSASAVDVFTASNTHTSRQRRHQLHAWPS